MSFAAALLLMASWLSAQSPYVPAEGVLVLRNGQTISGQIARHGESYQVMIAEGSEIRIPAHNVRLHSGSLEEAYRQQRDSLPLNNLTDRLRLASWCLTNDLPHRAADQLLMVRLEDPRHDDLPRMQRRLEALEMASRAARETQADLDQAANASPAPTPYDTSQLDEAIGQLEPAQVESFAQRIQPLLVNRCGASGCHGYGSKNQFHLMRPSFQATFTRRFTQRNLVAALAQIEKAVPEKSPLLEHAFRLHGGEKPPALLDKRTQQNELLAEWIRDLSGIKPEPTTAKPTGAPAKPAHVTPAAKELLQHQQQQQSPRRDEQVQQAAYEEEQADPIEPPQVDRRADPVDPAVFNRQYHGRP